MSSLWERVEPLLARVQKPSRYIGCEDGAITPRYAPGKVSWLLAYPDAYEIGLPNQGLQILFGVLDERQDAVAGRTDAPWNDLEAGLRQHGVPLFSAGAHRAANDFDLVAALFPTFDPVDVAPRVLRTRQWADHDGDLRDLVPL